MNKLLFLLLATPLFFVLALYGLLKILVTAMTKHIDGVDNWVWAKKYVDWLESKFKF